MAFMDVTEMCQLTEIELATLYNNSTSQKDENSTLEQFLAGHDVACKQLTFETLISILVPVIFAIIVLVGIVGNLLVLFVVLLKQQMRNTTNVLIVVSKTFWCVYADKVLIFFSMKNVIIFARCLSELCCITNYYFCPIIICTRHTNISKTQ